MKTIYFILINLLFGIHCVGQTGDWDFYQMPLGDVNLFSTFVSKHKLGYTMVGAFSTQLELAQYSISNQSGWGLYLAKYDTNGSPISLQKFGSAHLTAFGNNNFRIGLAIDSFNNTYIGLSFKDSIEVFNQKFYCDPVFNALLLKINSLGNLIWGKQISGVNGATFGYSQYLAINTDQSLSVAVAVSDSTQLDSFWISKGRGVFANLDTNGQAYSINTAGRDNVVGGYIGLVNSKQKNSYVLGLFESVNNVQYDTISVMAGDEYESSMFFSISKYDSIKHIQWVRHFGGATLGASFNANSIKTDSKGNVYVSGSCRISNFSSDWYKIQGGGLFGGSGKDVFILKYDKDGNFKWFRKTEYTDEEDWRGFDISDNDELYLSFNYHYKSILGSDSVLSIGGRDIAMVKLDTLGNVIWMNSVGGLGGDEAVSLLCSDTAVYLLGQSMSMPCHFNQTDHTTQAPGNLFLARLNKYELWPVSIREEELEAMSLYPNPSQGMATLTLPHAAQGYYSLHDMAGRELQKQNLYPSQTTYYINTSALNSGVYLLRVQTTQGSRSVKLVVE